VLPFWTKTKEFLVVEKFCAKEEVIVGGCRDTDYGDWTRHAWKNWIGQSWHNFGGK